MAALAQSGSVEPPGFSGAAFFLEEDAWNLVHPSDQNYTGGGALQVSGAWVKGAALPLEAIDHLTGLAGKLDELDGAAGRTYRGYSLMLGLTVFTPRELTSFDPIPQDRPYASLEFLTVSRASAFERLGLAISTELTLGVLGLDQGHQLQAAIHAASRAVKGCADEEPECTPHDPKGWPHQVSAGGEPTLRYGLTVERLLVDARAPGGAARFDLKGLGRLDLGYYTGAAAGLAFRAGVVRSPFWSYNTAPLNGQNQMVPAVAATPEQLGSLEVYLFGGLRGRAVGYNALLQGQLRPSVVAMSDSQVFRLLYELEVGATASFRGWGVTYMPFAGRSPELTAGLPLRHQIWTSIYLWYRAG
ncbi:MAG TPA: lipid A-modifier LpxR family protein [Myxococcales bacterium]|nr:lipid A-modifier LpxR family protein [Myxococcales bacterium]